MLINATYDPLEINIIIPVFKKCILISCFIAKSLVLSVSCLCLARLFDSNKTFGLRKIYIYIYGIKKSFQNHTNNQYLQINTAKIEMSKSIIAELRIRIYKTVQTSFNSSPLI